MPDGYFVPGTRPCGGSRGPSATQLEGRFRPGHFQGVLTIVSKLFHVLQPDVALFGQKDLQQAVLVRAMVRDLDFPLRVEVMPTVREADGLALSSRNVRLSASERSAAPVLFRALEAGAEAVARGERPPRSVRAEIVAVLDGVRAVLPDSSRWCARRIWARPRS